MASSYDPSFCTSDYKENNIKRTRSWPRLNVRDGHDINHDRPTIYPVVSRSWRDKTDESKELASSYKVSHGPNLRPPSPPPSRPSFSRVEDLFSTTRCEGLLIRPRIGRGSRRKALNPPRRCEVAAIRRAGACNICRYKKVKCFHVLTSAACPPPLMDGNGSHRRTRSRSRSRSLYQDTVVLLEQGAQRKPPPEVVFIDKEIADLAQNLLQIKSAHGSLQAAAKALGETVTFEENYGYTARPHLGVKTAPPIAELPTVASSPSPPSHVFQLQQMLHAHITQQSQYFTGWQAETAVLERLNHIWKMVTHLRQSASKYQQPQNLQIICSMALGFEKKTFEKTASKELYTKIMELQIEKLSIAAAQAELDAQARTDMEISEQDQEGDASQAESQNGDSELGYLPSSDDSIRSEGEEEEDEVVGPVEGDEKMKFRQAIPITPASTEFHNHFQNFHPEMDSNNLVGRIVDQQAARYKKLLKLRAKSCADAPGKSKS